ncbi:hypothetical protein MRBLWH7_000805 [Microbacterium sp. LWH7-1.2]|uniref:hypothetical protein n=1 Tax=Microbacterium sp. LWH7-1.2 TaxID=3135257 RepID=UPI003138AF29
MKQTDAPTIGNLISELQKYDPAFVITFGSDEPPEGVDEVVDLVTREPYWREASKA